MKCWAFPHNMYEAWDIHYSLYCFFFLIILSDFLDTICPQNSLAGLRSWDIPRAWPFFPHQAPSRMMSIQHAASPSSASGSCFIPSVGCHQQHELHGWAVSASGVSRLQGPVSDSRRWLLCLIVFILPTESCYKAHSSLNLGLGCSRNAIILRAVAEHLQ